MMYVLYNPETHQIVGERKMVFDGSLKEVHKFFDDPEIDFMVDVIKLEGLPDQKEDWVDDWKKVHNVYLELRDNMWHWWAMLYDEEKGHIVHTSNCNFCLEEKPEGAG